MSGAVSAMCEELEWPYILVLLAGIGAVFCGDWLTDWSRSNYAAGSNLDKWYARRIPPWSAGIAGVAAVIFAGVSAYQYLAAGCLSRPIPTSAAVVGIASGLLALGAVVRLLVARLVQNTGETTDPGGAVADGGFFSRVRLPRYRARVLLQYACLSALATLLAGVAFELLRSRA